MPHIEMMICFYDELYKNESSKQLSRVTAKTSRLYTKGTVTCTAIVMKWRELGVKQVVSVQDVFRLNLEINPILFRGF